MREDLEIAICKQIAVHSPFSTEEIRSAFRQCESFDILLEAIDYAGHYGFSSLEYAIGMILKEK